MCAVQLGRSDVDQVDLLLGEIRDALPPVIAVANYGYPDGLALCAIDSIQSIGVRYGAVENVVSRYRAFRKEEGGDGLTDDLIPLAATFDSVGGVTAWAEAIGNRHRTSTRPGAPLKAQVIWSVANHLPKLGVRTASDLRSFAADTSTAQPVESYWTSLPGQRSGISWRYLNMLAGVPGVKPDRMIRRFVARSLGDAAYKMSAAQIATLVQAASAELNVTASDLDHAIWLFQSGRARPLGLAAATAPAPA